MADPRLNLAAVDLGAESGRVMLAQFDGRMLSLKEAHRFPNTPVRVGGRVGNLGGETLHWDILRLFGDIKQGLRAAGQQANAALAGVGVDTWAIDFGLLDAEDQLIGNPVHYRDARTDGMMEAAFARVPREEIFKRTGIQFMQINTLYQLVALAQRAAPALDIARTFLTIPDLINFWLCGRKANEYTNATSTQALDARSKDWARDMLEKLGIPTAMFAEVVPPATQLGVLRPGLAEELGLGAIPVLAPATHDTGSAVAAVPTTSRDAIYLSSGTWSLMGIETLEPVIDARTLALNFTNEGGIGGTYRVLKNIMGLWLLQECRRAWLDAGHEYGYAQLESMARAADIDTIVLPSDPRFLAPNSPAVGDMPSRILAFCRETDQTPPSNDGEITRCVLNSLALEYRWVAERLAEISGLALPVIHIIGGGSQNTLLNQLTADATGRTVVAGPVEATAIGNIIAQLLALGQIGSLQDGRELVSRAFDVQRIEPHRDDRWDAAYERYLKLRERLA